MVGISSTLVKTLREKTGAGVIACKNALAETQAISRSGRRCGRGEEGRQRPPQAAEARQPRGGRKLGAIVELNTQTDFAARTPAFHEAASVLARLALDVNGDRDALLEARAPDGDGPT
jgi:elongation factor Ts